MFSVLHIFLTSAYKIFTCNASFVYDPANGVPKMPTASSAQIRRNIIRIAPISAIRYPVLFTLLKINSHMSPVPSSKIPITIKSSGDHFTSSVNCIAINGTDNKSATVSTMPITLLFLVSIYSFFDNRYKYRKALCISKQIRKKFPVLRQSLVKR